MLVKKNSVCIIVFNGTAKFLDLNTTTEGNEMDKLIELIQKLSFFDDLRVDNLVKGNAQAVQNIDERIGELLQELATYTTRGVVRRFDYLRFAAQLNIKL